mmetsp:Transcript_106304/g.274890  ORF Transcript_106304/g.274890 Transcript_106304/m.274890 type:complete len:301 (-) Transcript_106304:638-1540(-)
MELSARRRVAVAVHRLRPRHLERSAWVDVAGELQEVPRRHLEQPPRSECGEHVLPLQGGYVPACAGPGQRNRLHPLRAGQVRCLGRCLGMPGLRGRLVERRLRGDRVPRVPGGHLDLGQWGGAGLGLQELRPRVVLKLVRRGRGGGAAHADGGRGDLLRPWRRIGHGHDDDCHGHRCGRGCDRCQRHCRGGSSAGSGAGSRLSENRRRRGRPLDLVLAGRSAHWHRGLRVEVCVFFEAAAAAAAAAAGGPALWGGPRPRLHGAGGRGRGLGPTRQGWLRGEAIAAGIVVFVGLPQFRRCS